MHERDALGSAPEFSAEYPDLKNPTHFRKVMELYHATLFRYIQAKISHRQDAEDVLQEVWISLHEAAARWDGKRHVFVLLKTIASRRVADFYRKRESSAVPGKPPEPDVFASPNDGLLESGTFPLRTSATFDHPVDQAIKTEQARTVRNAVQQIGEPFKSILSGLIEEVPQVEMARALDMHPSTLNYYKKQALDLLTSALIHGRRCTVERH